MSSGRGRRQKRAAGVLCDTPRRRSYARHGERARLLLLRRRTRTTTATARPHTRHDRLRVGARKLRRRAPVRLRDGGRFNSASAAQLGARAVDEPPPTTQTPNFCLLIRVTFRSRHTFRCHVTWNFWGWVVGGEARKGLGWLVQIPVFTPLPHCLIQSATTTTAHHVRPPPSLRSTAHRRRHRHRQPRSPHTARGAPPSFFGFRASASSSLSAVDAAVQLSAVVLLFTQPSHSPASSHLPAPSSRSPPLPVTRRAPPTRPSSS